MSGELGCSPGSSSNFLLTLGESLHAPRSPWVGGLCAAVTRVAHGSNTEEYWAF